MTTSVVCDTRADTIGNSKFRTHESESNHTHTHTLCYIYVCVRQYHNVFVVKSRPWTCAVVELGELGTLLIDRVEMGRRRVKKTGGAKRKKKNYRKFRISKV